MTNTYTFPSIEALVAFVGSDEAASAPPWAYAAKRDGAFILVDDCGKPIVRPRRAFLTDDGFMLLETMHEVWTDGDLFYVGRECWAGTLIADVAERPDLAHRVAQIEILVA